MTGKGLNPYQRYYWSASSAYDLAETACVSIGFVLDGPLHALAHLLAELRNCPGAPALQPGDVVTTGTWTDAWPVQRGETWHAEFGAPLAPISVRFV